MSLTCLVVKVLERLIHRQVVRFLNDNDKINASQHGFRKAHSCQTQLLETIHQCMHGLKTLITHVAFLDFAKAFDSVPHEWLLLKLDHVGVRGELFRWMKAFLSNRQQRVLCNGCPWTWSRVVSGVLQGSILGPLLFLIYVNHIGDNLTSHPRLFADDCVIYREVSESSGCSTMQEDLVRVYEWTQKWTSTSYLFLSYSLFCFSFVVRSWVHNIGLPDCTTLSCGIKSFQIQIQSIRPIASSVPRF